jgi:hypothetical protein
LQSGPEDKFSLNAVAPRLTELLGQECKMAPDSKGAAVADLVRYVTPHVTLFVFSSTTCTSAVGIFLATSGVLCCALPH